MDTQDKNRLAELVEQLPEGEIQAAMRYLEYLKDRGDPYLKFLMNVPEEDEELTDGSRKSWMGPGGTSTTTR